MLREAAVLPIVREFTREEADAARQLYPNEGSVIIWEALGSNDLLVRVESGLGTSPEGMAVLHAAIDWRRIGLSEPVPESFLQRLFPDYLSAERPDAEPREELFTKGINWALEPVTASVSPMRLVTSDPERKFSVSDYLVDYFERSGRNEWVTIPKAVWNHAVAVSDSKAALNVGLAAQQRGERAVAEQAFRKAAGATDSGVAAVAMTALGHLYSDVGSLDEAENWLRRAIGAAAPVILPQAELDLGQLFELRGDLQSAQRHYERSANAPDKDVKPHAWLNLASLRSRLGDLEGAKAACEATIALGDPDTAAAAELVLATVLSQQGHLSRARVAYEKAIEQGRPDVAARAATSLGRLLAEQGDAEGALAAFERASSLGGLKRIASEANGSAKKTDQTD
jgi:tetratricopeptide (TPR) repeat protein